jgi:hypothetical protein
MREEEVLKRKAGRERVQLRDSVWQQVCGPYGFFR